MLIKHTNNYDTNASIQEDIFEHEESLYFNKKPPSYAVKNTSNADKFNKKLQHLVESKNFNPLGCANHSLANYFYSENRKRLKYEYYATTITEYLVHEKETNSKDLLLQDSNYKYLINHVPDSLIVPSRHKNKRRKSHESNSLVKLAETSSKLNVSTVSIRLDHRPANVDFLLKILEPYTNLNFINNLNPFSKPMHFKDDENEFEKFEKNMENPKRKQQFNAEGQSLKSKLLHFMRTITYYKRYIEPTLDYDKLCFIINDDKLKYKFYNLQRSVLASNDIYNNLISYGRKTYAKTLSYYRSKIYFLEMKDYLKYRLYNFRDYVFVYMINNYQWVVKYPQIVIYRLTEFVNRIYQTTIKFFDTTKKIVLNKPNEVVYDYNMSMFEMNLEGIRGMRSSLDKRKDNYYKMRKKTDYYKKILNMSVNTSYSKLNHSRSSQTNLNTSKQPSVWVNPQEFANEVIKQRLNSQDFNHQVFGQRHKDEKQFLSEKYDDKLKKEYIDEYHAFEGDRLSYKKLINVDKQSKRVKKMDDVEFQKVERLRNIHNREFVQKEKEKKVKDQAAKIASEINNNMKKMNNLTQDVMNANTFYGVEEDKDEQDDDDGVEEKYLQYDVLDTELLEMNDDMFIEHYLRKGGGKDSHDSLNKSMLDERNTKTVKVSRVSLADNVKGSSLFEKYNSFKNLGKKSLKKSSVKV